MAVNSKVFKGVLFTDSFKNYIATEHVSLCDFLHFLDITDIAQHIENNFYSNKDWHFRYEIEAMIKLLILKCFRQLSFKKTIASLTEEEAWVLGFKEKNGFIQIPSGATLHHFMKYRLGVKGTDQIIMILGSKIAKLSDSKKAKTDSTPLEASRYDTHSDYNGHYECKMDKAHITMVGTHPVFMTYTKGNSGDSPELSAHIDALVEQDIKVEEHALDGGYDSFRNHAEIWYKLSARPIIFPRENAVINEDGKLHRIDHWANKMWKLGGSKYMKIEGKLKLLYEQGREEQVGMYFRNHNLRDEIFPDLYSHRQECERIHAHIKSTVKFDVRKIQWKSRELYSKLNFVAYQLLLLTNLQNKVVPAESFERYF